MAEGLKHKTKVGIYWAAIGDFSNYGLQFVVGIIMARLLTPSDYGITAIPAVIIAILEVFIDGGFATAMVRKPELNDRDISTAFIYSFSVGILCYLLIFFGAPYIADFYAEPILTPLIRITTLSFLWSPLATPQNILLQRKLDFKTPAKIAIVTKIIGAGLGITFAYCGYGLWALVIMSVVSSFISFLLTWIAVRWKPVLEWSKESFRYLWNFGNKLIASALIDTTYNNLTPLIVGKFYSTADLGVYNRARSYANLPASQGTNIIKKVTFPVLSKLQDNDKQLADNYRKMLKISAFVIFPVMTIMSALAKPLIIILLTEKWIEAIPLLQIICFSSMWYPIHAINLNLLQVKGRSDLFLKLEIWKKAIGLTVMACTLPFGLIYFVSAGIASSLVCLFINTYYTGKLINVGFAKQMKDLFPTLIISMISFAIALFTTYLFDNLYMELFIGGFCAVSFYIAIAFIFRFSELDDVKYMINLRKK